MKFSLRISMVATLLFFALSIHSQESDRDYFSENIGTLKFIPAGSFINGVASVKISSFRMAESEITQKQYQSITGNNPSRFISDANHDNFPVERVSWYDAVRFCNLLSLAESLDPVYSLNGSSDPAKWGSVPRHKGTDWDKIVFNTSANGYRLPTDSEWEYASRANTTSKYYWGNSDEYEVVSRYALTADNAHRNSTSPIAIKQKLPNQWGLYDTASNVWEWCWDWWGELPKKELDNPTGPQNGSSRVQRGGGWNGDAGLSPLRRAGNEPISRYDNLGFRVARK
jgi:formylglycine-generating enzyme required for sulfatase activity